MGGLDGDWLFYSEWKSDRNYYSSACSAELALRVSQATTPTPAPTLPPTDWFRLPLLYLVVGLVAVVAAVLMVYALIKRKKLEKKKPS